MWELELNSEFKNYNNQQNVTEYHDIHEDICSVCDV